MNYYPQKPSSFEAGVLTTAPLECPNPIKVIKYALNQMFLIASSVGTKDQKGVHVSATSKWHQADCLHPRITPALQAIDVHFFFQSIAGLSTDGDSTDASVHLRKAK